METLVGIIDKVIWESQDSEFKVLQIKRRDRSLLKITGEFANAPIGVKIEAHGNWKTHPKYGTSFQTNSHTFGHSGDSRSICLYLQAIAKWIGPDRAKAIADHFGEKTIEIIETKPERLTEVEGVGEKSAQSLVDAWILNKSVKDLHLFLHNIGLSTFRIRKIIATYGSEAEEIIRANPWTLTEHGFGFSSCDYIADKLGSDMQGESRWRNYLLYSLKQCMDNGHLYLVPDELLSILSKFNKITQWPLKNGEILADDLQAHIDQLVLDGYVVKDSNKVYWVDAYFYENESAKLMANMQGTSDTCKLSNTDIEPFIEKYETQEGITFSDDQRDAVRYFVTDKIMVITGGPGCGKTTCTKALVQILKSNNISFELLTPTGIAAKRLGDTAGHQAYTIHRRLGFKGAQWDYNSINKYSTQAVIIDEASMIDQELLYRLLSALHSSTKIVFVGDVDQLPSVGPGCVLRELISCGLFKTIRLNQIFRQEQCSDIIKAAKKINEGDTDLSLFKNDSKSDIWFIQEKEPSKVEETIIRMAENFKNVSKERKEPIRFQIITPRNEGPVSVASLNVALQGALNPPDKDKKEVKLNQQIIRKGDRVMVRKNSYQLDVFNGEIGKVAHITPDWITVDVEDYKGTKRVDVPMKLTDEILKLAYSISYHKCLPADTRVFTPKGLIKIQDSENAEVLTRNGVYPVVLHSNTGLKTLYEVTTKSGRVLGCSGEHVHYISDEGGISTISTVDLSEKISKQGEIYYCTYLGGYCGEPQKVSFNNTSDRETKKFINLPEYLDTDLSWLLGLMVGDGCYTDKKDGTVEVTSPDSPELLYEFERIIRGYGLNVCDHNKKGRLYGKYVCSRNFRDWMLSIGMDYTPAHEKTIPGIIFNASKECRASFIGGLFDTDGCISKSKYFRYTTSSGKLAKGFQVLLLSLGIVSFIEKQGDRHYKVVISGDDLRKAQEIIKIKDLRRSEQYSTCAPTKKTNHYVIPFGKIIANHFRSAFKAKEGSSRGIQGKELFSRYKSLSLQINAVLTDINKMRQPLLDDVLKISSIEGIPAHPLLQQVYDQKLYFDEIISVKNTGIKVEMCDIEVSKEHSYIAEGFICHNSQGTEYPLVILCLLKAHGSMLLQRNLLYTGLTRAKKKVIVIGQASAIEAAITNDKIQRRNTAFKERLQLWMQGKGISLRSLYSTPGNCQNSLNLGKLLSLEEVESM